ncbi:GlxA family transcriptional regulator [Pararcticibacter amylolyticus]|uniref:AraC family transcriptional regulator n=1 Tax=Pararcticibacter amylolyticus TaxID=2173175 RepID=A0A2U2PLB5_9SPHI|nr:helix-turn-helix domain-containing protein [Pararcticibacter amylolyticus]PWG82195.1 AraC family transcriptional regulator [Pararcticibacter amylolyticus]
MKHVTILIPEGETSLSNIEATYKMFNKVNEALTASGKKPLFTVQLAGLNKETSLTNGLFSVKAGLTIKDVDATNLIIIPAVHGDVNKVLTDNRELIPWLTRQYGQGAEIVSLCIGAFILASTGLLNGKVCTTHWLMADEFRSMFPEVNLQAYKIITDEAGIYTSGGAYSSLNLILYLVEKFAGREMALLSSKVFEIDIERSSQSPFIIFKGQKEHHDEVIKKTQIFIENHYHEKITVDQLASIFAISRRHLERRFKKATSNTVLEYVQRVRIEAAKMSLESLRENVNEVMYKTGYTDPKAFRTIFRKITGLSPLEYRSRYNKAINAA